MIGIQWDISWNVVGFFPAISGTLQTSNIAKFTTVRYPWNADDVPIKHRDNHQTWWLPYLYFAPSTGKWMVNLIRWDWWGFWKSTMPCTCVLAFIEVAQFSRSNLQIFICSPWMYINTCFFLRNRDRFGSKLLRVLFVVQKARPVDCSSHFLDTTCFKTIIVFFVPHLSMFKGFFEV